VFQPDAEKRPSLSVRTTIVGGAGFAVVIG
jgi:hypothetical protein